MTITTPLVIVTLGFIIKSQLTVHCYPNKLFWKDLFSDSKMSSTFSLWVLKLSLDNLQNVQNNVHRPTNISKSLNGEANIDVWLCVNSCAS